MLAAHLINRRPAGSPSANSYNGIWCRLLAGNWRGVRKSAEMIIDKWRESGSIMLVICRPKVTRRMCEAAFQYAWPSSRNEGGRVLNRGTAGVGRTSFGGLAVLKEAASPAERKWPLIKAGVKLLHRIIVFTGWGEKFAGEVESISVELAMASKSAS